MTNLHLLFKMIVVTSLSLFFMVSCINSNSDEVVYNAKESMRIALVTDTIVSDASFLNEAVKALSAMQSAHHFEGRHVVADDNLAWSIKVRELTIQGYDLIIGIGWQASILFPKIQEKFPEIKFAVINTPVVSNHIKSVVYPDKEGAYVLGVMIATAFPGERKFGYLDCIHSRANLNYRHGFEQGVRSVIPDATIVLELVDTYMDAEPVYDKALKLYEAVNVIVGMVGTHANQGLFKATSELHAKGREVYATGMGVDQTTPRNINIIGGLTKNTGIATKLIIEEFLNGTFMPNVYKIDFETGALGILFATENTVRYRNKKIVSLEVISAGRDVVEDIIAGKIDLD